VAVANIPDLNLLPYFYGQDQTTLQATVTQWNKVVRQEVKAHGDILVDVYSETSDLLGHPEYLSGDGLHPSTLGYQQIANYFYEVLKANGVI
jgi:lysophospholipase L1-like esterase